MINSLKIRPAVSDDTSIIAEFNLAMALETEHLQLNPEGILLGVQNLMSRPQAGFYLVGEIDDMIVASLMVTFEWSDWRNGFFWWIQSVYVKPDYRHQGIYNAMYNAVKELAANSSEPVIGFRLYVDEHNRLAQKVYTFQGMKKTDYLLFEELI